MGLPMVADGSASARRLEQMLGLAEQVGEQAVVVDPVLADQLAAIITVPERAFDGALVGDRAQPPGAEDVRRLAGAVEA